ncbi:unnamed protein product [Schistosoma mattheei]|uniref:Uncharacterized protein n=1 Tax=Schistosoma mattheei TaxID=31246 RepID=A0A183NSH9_9TREM|nr:unnamed protein product [Schistosoma mattheei]
MSWTEDQFTNQTSEPTYDLSLNYKECLQGVGKARHLCEKHLFRDYENSPKRLFSYIKRLSKKSDGILPHSTRKNPFIWTRNDNEEALSRYFRKVSSTNIGEQPTINFDDDGLPTDPVVVEKGVALRVLQHHEPDTSSGLDVIHSVIMKAHGDLIAELLLIIGFERSHKNPSFRISKAEGLLGVRWTARIPGVLIIRWSFVATKPQNHHEEH